MILKYKNDTTWGYIDNIRQIATQSLDCELLIKQYDAEVEGGVMEDIASYLDEVPLADNIKEINKIFLMSTKDIDVKNAINAHSENLILPSIECDITQCTTELILVYVEDCKEYDAICLVTNQKAFLMNDKGQTIERLN